MSMSTSMRGLPMLMDIMDMTIIELKKVVTVSVIMMSMGMLNEIHLAWVHHHHRNQDHHQ